MTPFGVQKSPFTVPPCFVLLNREGASVDVWNTNLALIFADPMEEGEEQRMTQCRICRREFPDDQLRQLSKRQHRIQMLSEIATYVPLVLVGIVGGELVFYGPVNVGDFNKTGRYCDQCIEWLPNRLLLILLWATGVCVIGVLFVFWLTGGFRNGLRRGDSSDLATDPRTQRLIPAKQQVDGK